MRRTIFAASLALSVLVPATLATAQSADDKAMAQQIGRDLKDSGQLRDYRIGVKCQDGVAWLSGTVANEQQLATAVRLTQGLQGVDRVVNNLTIVTTPSASGGGNSMEFSRPLQQASVQGAAYGRPRVNQAYVPAQATPPARAARMPRRNNMPLPARPMPARPMPNQMSYARANGPVQAGCACEGPGGYGGGMMGNGMMGGGPAPMGYVPGASGGAVSYDNASMPGYAWPSYASYPNYAALTYPRQYSPTAWPYIGPFYPYPQVPLGWRKVALEWDDGWWFLDFSDCGSNH